jgi:hypothetical protein
LDGGVFQSLRGAKAAEPAAEDYDFVWVSHS